MSTTSDIIRILPARTRTAWLVALVAAVMAVVAAFALPTGASAQARKCPPGDFCIWEHAGYKGGWYHRHASDRNLLDNHFQHPRTGRRLKGIVGDHGSSVFNAGTADVAKDDVRVYFFSSPENSPSLCIPRGTRIKNLSRRSAGGTRDWNDAIIRFRWVRSC